MQRGQISFDQLKFEMPIRHLNGDFFFYRLKAGRRLIQGRKITEAIVTGFIEHGKLKASLT